MYSGLAWWIAGISIALLVVLWHYMVFRELERQRQVLKQLAAQVALNLAAEQKAQKPYEGSARHALEVSRSVYRKAAIEYNVQRRKPFYRIPAKLMGFSVQAEEPSGLPNEDYKSI